MAKTEDVRLQKLHHPSGEVLPMAWMLEDRHCGGSSRVEERVRRVGDLYKALLADSISDPDRHLFEKGFDIDQARRALNWATRNVGRTKAIVPSMRNRRVNCWLGFLRWLAARRAHTLSTNGDGDGVRRALVTAGITESFLRRQRVPEASSTERFPFTPSELQVLEEKLRADPLDGGIEHRNWCLYQLCRQGLRVQEALALYRRDIGERESATEGIIRSVEERALRIRVERRPDDPLDPRSYKAKTKRGGRWVQMSDEAMEVLWAYAEVHADAPDPFLIRTWDGKRALSASRANGLQAEVRPALAQSFTERFPGVPCSLDRFGWHRLRHTRAWMLILAMVQGREVKELTESEVERLLEIMGWRSTASARPYTRRLKLIFGERALHRRRYGP